MKIKYLFLIVFLLIFTNCYNSTVKITDNYLIIHRDPYDKGYIGYTLTSNSFVDGHEFAIQNLRNIKYNDQIIIAEQKTDSTNRWFIVKAKGQKLSYYMIDTLIYNQTKHQVDSIINRYQHTDFKELIFNKD